MKVQQAAKDTPQEIQWFGKINSERRNDPLLRYIYEARNYGEHGLEHSVHHSGFRYVIGPKEGSSEKNIVITNIRPGADGHFDFIGPDGKAIDAVITATPGKSVLREVTERDGKRKVPPPTVHLGKNMEPDPIVAAKLSLDWLEVLVATAQAKQYP